MSRYVTKKHGLIIGSDNIFFYKDDEGFHDFPAVVSIQSYYFPSHSTAHVGVRTLAEQFIWREESAEVEVTEGAFKGFLRTETKLHLRSFVKWWLDENAPGYGISPNNRPNDCCIFFAKRGHALAFTRMVEEMLDGVEFL